MLMRHAAATAFDGVADNVKVCALAMRTLPAGICFTFAPNSRCMDCGQVKCMGSGATAVDPMSHAQLLDEMHNSVFCLMPPGDWASSNRLGEAILAGCIPVVGCRCCCLAGAQCSASGIVLGCLGQCGPLSTDSVHGLVRSSMAHHGTPCL